MRHFLPALGAALVLSLGAHAASAQQAPAAAKPPHDPFFWLGEINKATAVINTDQGLLDKS
ncbi:MAG: argininosuccinate lyase, partial [Achromobacter sp.]